MSLLFLLFDYKCLVYGRSTCNLTESRLKVISKYIYSISNAYTRQINQSCSYKPLGCCMVKPNEQLVQVSYMHRCTSTPCLSTSQSSTALQGNLILRWASRLDAFSDYPIRTQLPGNATGVTTRTPEVRPLWSSRTRSRSSQISNAHGRQGPNCLTTF